MLYLTFDSWRKMLPKTANSLAWDFEAQSESCNELGWLQRKAHFHPQCISIIVHVYIHIHTIPYLYPYYPYLNLYWFELWKLAQAGVGYSAVVQQFVEQIKQYTEQWEERMKRDATVLPLSNLSLSPWLFKDTCWNPKKKVYDIEIFYKHQPKEVVSQPLMCAQNKDESNNFDQRHDLELARKSVYPIVEAGILKTTLRKLGKCWGLKKDRYGKQVENRWDMGTPENLGHTESCIEQIMSNPGTQNEQRLWIHCPIFGLSPGWIARTGGRPDARGAPQVELLSSAQIWIDPCFICYLVIPGGCTCQRKFEGTSVLRIFMMAKNEWNGMDWNGLEWLGMELNGILNWMEYWIEWNGIGMEWDWNGMDWTGLEWIGMEWRLNGMLNWIEWNGMEWNGLEWNGLDWNGLEWIGMTWHGTKPSSFRFWRKSRTKASLQHLQLSDFEGSLARKLRFHICHFQILREVSHESFVFASSAFTFGGKSRTKVSFSHLTL